MNDFKNINNAQDFKDFHTYLAPAKINLFLHITGQRADGYHTLQSVFEMLDFYDTLHIKVMQANVVKRVQDMQDVPADEDICTKAAHALKKATNCQLGVEYYVEKKIPMGAGLGGGSSDAATMLMALNQLWQLNLSRTMLMQIGFTLGADVPVFIFGQTAWAEGIGEVLSAVNLPPHFKECYYLVVTPQIHVSTAQVFANTRLTKDTKPLKIALFSSGEYISVFKNDLEKVVCDEFGAVKTVFDWLNSFGDAKMSGSGASVFITLKSFKLASELLIKIPANCTAFVAKGIKFHPHFDLK